MWTARKALAASAVTITLLFSLGWLKTLATNNETSLQESGAADPVVELDRRITALEKVAPFLVVDRQGKVIFQVDSNTTENTADVFNPNGKSAAAMFANSDGGSFMAIGNDDSTRSFLNFEKSRPGLGFNGPVTENPSAQGSPNPQTEMGSRIDLGRGEAGNYAIRFFAGLNNVIAGIGESKAGTGVMVIGDLKNETRAGAAVGDDGKGFWGIKNAGGKPVLSFGEAIGNTGGELAIGDSNSEPRVKMGTNDNKYGVVIALPQGLPYITRAGLPGSYMLGCAGGPSCVP